MYLALDRPKTRQELAAESGLADASVQKHLRSLLAAKLVRQVPADSGSRPEAHLYERRVTLNASRLTAVHQKVVKRLGSTPAPSVLTPFESTKPHVEGAQPTYSDAQQPLSWPLVAALLGVVGLISLVLFVTTRASTSPVPSTAPGDTMALPSTTANDLPARPVASASSGTSEQPGSPPEPSRRAKPEVFTGPVFTRGGYRFSASQANQYVAAVRNSAHGNPDLFENLDGYSNEELVEVGADACLWRRKGGDYRELLTLAGYGLFEANIYTSAAEAFLCR